MASRVIKEQILPILAIQVLFFIRCLIFYAISLKQKTHANAQDANWWIGDGAVNPRFSKAIRSMENPSSELLAEEFRQAKHVSEIASDIINNPTAGNDWGGVHLYSGISNRVFCLAAKWIGGPSSRTPLKIWHAASKAARPYWCQSRENSKTFAHKTMVAAKQYGEEIENAVGQAWREVGVTPKKRRYRFFNCLSGK